MIEGSSTPSQQNWVRDLYLQNPAVMSSHRKRGAQESNKEHPLRVQYHPGLGSGGTDEILRPLLMTVGDQDRCYRLVKESFGRRESDQGQTGVVTHVSGEGESVHHDRHHPQLPAFQGYKKAENSTKFNTLRMHFIQIQNAIGNWC